MIAMSGIFPADIDLRIRPMLEGCFTDLYALAYEYSSRFDGQRQDRLCYRQHALYVQAFPAW